MKKFIGLLLLVSTMSDASPTSDQEITALLNVLQHSDCQFERSGTWYSGERAAAHLQDKWDYAKDEIDSSETFIRKIATGSWLTGSSYHVKCDQTMTTSAQWLNTQLQQLRTSQQSSPADSLQ
ncbi:DUF5329 family protein [Vibrio mangrovi]|uniref:DUF5329 family protein n=1 Tax=Vibrio mangrovi TaxID=474394 RepID=A0A1Y6IQK1_9VIBR|nr:DUF5329 family protein [Vibrio mangrovi]MDW6003287.1 DUF5329 family protein [Vibrio mangrovi]SMR99924.1 hypothetical protein VIM7927_01162 [Vibrio mangrovi]